MSSLHQSEHEKIELEHQAAKIFMRWYEHDTGHHIRHLWHNKPNKPDVSCRLDGERLDLEIAHLYGSEQEAMQILGRELSELTRAELQQLEQSTLPNQRLLKALNRILLNKSHKQYKTKKVWLVIRNAHPAWDTAQIVALQPCIDVPSTHPFEQIWLVGDWQGNSGIVRLYP
ncbi:MAG: hypothetical protein NWQ54_21755 [Paraglaciecola sp.]|uniref:hypothetical protein n=1 Tax=Pseudomonadati TaxID=3379134 RepID=UPI00273EFA32|nr:hypothetical protein [Paraglaciecola sp.]MDP5032942.1 hypothetical protein [Paraglaciecola sp.]MDP5133517.1 hypothetical protein [Paraglaciecola sp.]